MDNILLTNLTHELSRTFVLSLETIVMTGLAPIFVSLARTGMFTAVAAFVEAVSFTAVGAWGIAFTVTVTVALPLTRVPLVTV